MNYSEYRFTLDLQKHQSQTTIAVFQGDTAVRLYISLTDGGKPYLLGDRSLATFYGKRPDGKPLVHSCFIMNSAEIMYEFLPATTSVLGIVNCQCRIYSKMQELITAPRFAIQVEERVVGDDDFNPTDEEMSIIDKITEAELRRVEQENARIYNEGIRQLNEFGGIDDEGNTVVGRIDAERARESKEAERQSNEKKRNENVQKALEEITKTDGTIDAKISTHNESDNAHSDIREAITEITEDSGTIDAKISTHNESDNAHSDIRNAITEITEAEGILESKITSEISNHNAHAEAHSDIRTTITNITKDNGTIDSKVSTAVSNHNSSKDAHSDIRDAVAELEDTLNTFLESDDSAIVDMRELLQAIQEDKDIIGELTKESLKADDVQDNLDSTETKKPLSANQGRVLQENKLDISRPNSTTEWSYSRIPVFSNIYNADKPVFLLDVTPSSATGHSIPRRDKDGNLVAPNTQALPEYNSDGTLVKDYYAGVAYVLNKINGLKAELTFEPIKITTFKVEGTTEFEWGSAASGIQLECKTSKAVGSYYIDNSLTTFAENRTSTEWVTNIGASYTGHRSFELKVYDPEKTEIYATASASITFKYKVFYGVSESAKITVDEMKNLSSTLTNTRKRTFTVDTGNKAKPKYGYYCVPKESPYSVDTFGECSFSYPGGEGGFEPAYEVSYTKNQKTTTYLVYRTTNSGFGTKEFTVK